MSRRRAKSEGTPADDEVAFLSAYDPDAYERLSLAVDLALVSIVDEAIVTLLVRRQEHPFRDRLSLPGGFVTPRESLDEAAGRVLRDKVGLDKVYLEQLYTFGACDRDPRTRVVSVAYYALVEPRRFVGAAASDQGTSIGRIEVPWSGEEGGLVIVRDAAGRVQPLAFDHGDMLGLVVRRLRGKLDYAPVGFRLLPREFTLLALQKVHEAILGRRLNKDSFRRRMLAQGFLHATGCMQIGRGRPAELYRFRKEARG